MKRHASSLARVSAQRDRLSEFRQLRVYDLGSHPTSPCCGESACFTRQSVQKVSRPQALKARISVSNTLFGVTYSATRGGTFEKSGPSPSAIVGCARTASRSLQYGRFASIRRLHRGHDLAGRGANHREADNEVVAHTDKNLHETLCFVRRLCSQHRAHRQLRHPRGDALALRAQSHVGEWRVREQAVWNQPIARAALASGQVVPDDSKVVDGYVRELWTTGAFQRKLPSASCLATRRSTCALKSKAMEIRTLLRSGPSEPSGGDGRCASSTQKAHQRARIER